MADVKEKEIVYLFFSEDYLKNSNFTCSGLIVALFEIFSLRDITLMNCY